LQFPGSIPASFSVNIFYIFFTTSETSSKLYDLFSLIRSTGRCGDAFGGNRHTSSHNNNSIILLLLQLELPQRTGRAVDTDGPDYTSGKRSERSKCRKIGVIE
jgi:hypothetical protein